MYATLGATAIEWFVDVNDGAGSASRLTVTATTEAEAAAKGLALRPGWTVQAVRPKAGIVASAAAYGAGASEAEQQAAYDAAAAAAIAEAGAPDVALAAVGGGGRWVPLLMIGALGFALMRKR